jgi:hypothetical protein
MTGLPSRPLRAIAYGLWAAVLLAYLAYALIFGIYAAALFRFPFDYDQGEGFELLDAIYFARGQWPYRDIEAYPFYASNYPPLFHRAGRSAGVDLRAAADRRAAALDGGDPGPGGWRWAWRSGGGPGAGPSRDGRGGWCWPRITSITSARSPAAI